MDNRIHKENIQVDHIKKYKEVKDIETGNFSLSIRLETQQQAKIKEKEKDLKKLEKIGIKDIILKASEELLRLDPLNEEAMRARKELV